MIATIFPEIPLGLIFLLIVVAAIISAALQRGEEDTQDEWS